MVNESIVKVAIMARRAGMSYGAYVAQNPHGLPQDEAGLHPGGTEVLRCLRNGTSAGEQKLLLPGVPHGGNEDEGP